jgi:hypothetical protein
MPEKGAHVVWRKKGCQRPIFQPSMTFNVCTIITNNTHVKLITYRGADKSLARLTARCILFDGENISFYASLVLYIYIYMYK